MPRKLNGSRRGEKSVLDQGVAINGELQVQLFNMKLLPVKVRLLISSKDLAADLGLDWWRADAKQRDLERVSEKASRQRRRPARQGGAPHGRPVPNGRRRG